MSEAALTDTPPVKRLPIDEEPGDRELLVWADALRRLRLASTATEDTVRQEAAAG